MARLNFECKKNHVLHVSIFKRYIILINHLNCMTHVILYCIHMCADVSSFQNPKHFVQYMETYRYAHFANSTTKSTMCKVPYE